MRSMGTKGDFFLCREAKSSYIILQEVSEDMNVLIGLIIMFVFGFMPWCLCRASAGADQQMEEIWRAMGEKTDKKM